MKAHQPPERIAASPHEESDTLADPHRDLDSRRPRRLSETSRRYIALRFTLTATYHESWAEAEEVLAAIPAPRRAAIVDTQTGQTLAAQAVYPEVQAAVGGEVLGIMRRDGPLGDLAYALRCRSRDSGDPE